MRFIIMALALMAMFSTASAGCPNGYTQRGTLSSNNDISGSELGSIGRDTIALCKQACNNNDECVSFMYRSDDGKCKLSDGWDPTSSWGTNWRFCMSDERTVPACSNGAVMTGSSITSNNHSPNIIETVENVVTIEDCEETCEQHVSCLAYGYGGVTSDHMDYTCILYGDAEPDGSTYGANWRFCRLQTVCGWKEFLTDEECDWNDVDSENRASLGGGGHSLEDCRQKCEDRGELCHYWGIKESTGYCHMFKTCDGRKDNGGYVVYERNCEFYECESPGQIPKYSTMDNVNVDTFLECSKACSSNQNCNGFDFREDCDASNCCRLTQSYGDPRTADNPREYCAVAPNPDAAVGESNAIVSESIQSTHVVMFFMLGAVIALIYGANSYFCAKIKQDDYEKLNSELNAEL